MITTPLWLWMASGMSLITWAIHTFAGGREIAQPLLHSNLKDVPKYTNYYCWHLVTIMLLALAAAFAIGARYSSAWELPMAATILSGLFALWSIILIIWKRQKWFYLPQWTLFLVIFAFGILGLR